MTGDLTVWQRLTLAKFLLENIGKTRTDVMVPASRDEMPSGSRMPAMFGGKLAGWVSMPKPKQPSARVTEPVKLLAWVEENYPAQVVTETEVVVTDELIGHLREHFPSSLRPVRKVDPHLVSDICGALKDRGGYPDGNGERVTDIPGVTLPDADPPVPTVNLTDDAAEIIGAAWRDGAIPVGELLALPSGGDTDAT